MTSEINLHLPDHVFRRVARYARKRNQDIETAIVDYLEQHLPAGGPVDAPAAGDPDREVAAFRAMHTQLREQYEGQYVAIHDGEVVDHDQDRLALYERIEKRYPDQFVLMRPVGPQPDREFHFRSPRLERRAQ